jgi:hypothetical protein
MTRRGTDVLVWENPLLELQFDDYEVRRYDAAEAEDR